MISGGFLGVISRPVIEFATSNVQKKMFQFSFIEKNGYQIAKWDKYFMPPPNYKIIYKWKWFGLQKDTLRHIYIFSKNNFII